MKTTVEYILVVNGNPFVSVVTESAIEVLHADALIRFGPNAKVEVFKHTTEPYALGADNDK